MPVRGDQDCLIYGMRLNGSRSAQNDILKKIRVSGGFNIVAWII
jgi:hypothetical protein